MSKRVKAKTSPSGTTSLDPYERLLADFATLRIPLTREQLDTAVQRAERERLSQLDFLQVLIGTQAAERRERSIAHRLRDARFREPKTLATFDWHFNAPAIDRRQIEELASGAFIRRHDNLVIVGQSGLGKSHLITALGQQACVQGYRVRYTTSAGLLEDLTAALADQTLPRRVRYWAGFDLLILDEFGFERIERQEARQAASLLYKVIDARSQKRSTALVTNIDFEAWGEYLQDPPLAMAFLDRIVDGAIILKLKGKSYRMHRAQQQTKVSNPTE
jgi:DNA replication protein DnaC